MPDRVSRSEQQRRTREAIVGAAEELFVAQGFHATSVDQVAAAAGYTKGAVYSNFAAKEDLFFAVYERRSERGVADMERTIAAAGGGAAGLEALTVAAAGRRGHDDGWLAVFFEFWAHVVRRPALRERFATIHRRALEPLVTAQAEHAAAHGRELGDQARPMTVAAYAMQLGLGLERLILPDLVDDDLAREMGRVMLDAFVGPTEKETGDGPRLSPDPAG